MGGVLRRRRTGAEAFMSSIPSKHTRRGAFLAAAAGAVLLLLPFTASAVTLAAGQVVIVYNRSVIEYDFATGQGVNFSWNQYLASPVHVTVDSRHRVFVSDATSGIIEVDPATGTQTVVASVSQLGGAPAGVCAAPDGRLYVALAGAAAGIVTIPPEGGAPAAVSSGTLMTALGGLAYGPDGMLYVCEQATPVTTCDGVEKHGSIVRVDPASGAQTLLATSCSFFYPFDIVVVGPDELWTVQHTSLGLYGGIFRTKISDGSTSSTSVGALRPTSIAAAPGGSVYWGDCRLIHHDCDGYYTAAWPSGGQLSNIVGPMAVVPDMLLPAKSTTWGALKILYR